MRLPKKVRLPFFLTALAFVIMGCSSRHSTSETKISPIFNVCISDTRDRYTLNESKVVDWDDGVLLSDNKAIDVYVGEHPDYQRDSTPLPKTAGGTFTLVGTQKISDTAKALYVETSGKRPIYVMLKSKDLEPKSLIERMTPHHIRYCAK